jgi:hypothetical protein
MATLTTKQRKAMPASKFAGGKGGKAGDTGRFPLNDKRHVAAAESYERYATPAEKTRIDAAAKRDFPNGKKGAGMVKKPGKK